MSGEVEQGVDPLPVQRRRVSDLRLDAWRNDMIDATWKPSIEAKPETISWPSR